MTKHFDVDYRNGKYHMFIDGSSSNTEIEDEVKSELDDWIEEWSDFPEHVTDDLVDMGSQGVLKLRERADVQQIFIGRA